MATTSSISKAPRPASRAKAHPEADDAVYSRVLAAILQGSLKAGTKLSEPKLAEIFGVSRERVRKALHRLAAERRLEITPNRGARVPKPTLEDVKTVYTAHRVVEAGVLTQLLSNLPTGLLDKLDAHLREEQLAAERRDRAASVRLSGAFHLHLVDALGNDELSRITRDLISRSSVMVTLYEAATDSPCAVDEHGAIVAALRARDLTQALTLSREHFEHVEHRLHLDSSEPPEADLASIFGGAP